MSELSQRERRAKLYECYREYVEFLNQMRLGQPFTSVLLAMPSVILLGDLLAGLASDDTFVSELAYFGVSPALMQMIGNSPTLLYLGAGFMLAALLASLLAILSIALANASEEKYFNGIYKHNYQRSLLNSALRAFVACYVHFFMPLFSSLGTKFTSMEEKGATLAGSTVLVLVVLNCIIIEYHTFQIGPEGENAGELAVANFPHRMLDDFLIVLGIVLVDVAGGLAAGFIATGFLVLRIAAASYLPFYSGKNQKTHLTILLASMIASSGIIAARLDGHYYLFLLASAALIGLLLVSRRQQGWQRLSSDQGEQLSVIRTRLFKEGCYVRAFRQLIILSRKNNSHRTQLQIQILKSHCTDLERLNRGGMRKCSSEDVIHFQEAAVQFLENFLKAAELGVSVLKFLQQREARKQVLARNVGNLVGLLVANKAVLQRMLELNQYSPQLRLLLAQGYGQFYQDHAYLKETEKWMQETRTGTAEHQVKERFFSQRTAVVFINILEEVGKIVRISKNLPGVLGFLPSNLVGLSVNEIIPFSIKPFHDAGLVRFIESCNEKDRYSNFDLQFYAYNSQFHLQEVKIHYNWVMTDFHSFHMAGVIQRIDSDANVILTDSRGYLEGWTRKIGAEEFNFDELSIAERRNFNILPLFPTLIKYMDSLGVNARTIFFKNQKSKDQHLAIPPNDDLPTFQASLLATFRKMMKEEELVGACFAEVEMTKLSLCRGQAKMLKFVIRQYDRLENFSELTSLIESLSFSADNRKDKSLVEQTNNEMNQGSEKQALSIFSEDEKTDRKIDSNFSLQPEGNHILTVQQLVFGQFSASRTSFQLTNMYQNHLKKRSEKEEKKTAAPDSAFNPTLQRHTTLFFYVIALTTAFLALVIFDILAVRSTGAAMSGKCERVVRRNRAAMIYLKSIFNPNSTYIGQFSQGSLLEDQEYLFTQAVNYTTFLGDTIRLNKYYLFNTQVPATLQRLLRPPLAINNNTVNIIPPTSAVYYSEVSKNSELLVREYDKKFGDTLAKWSQEVGSARKGLFLRVGLLSGLSVAYMLLLVLLYLRERQHKETLESFFKFQKEQLQRKVLGLGIVVRHVEAQVSEWHLLKQFNEIVKREDITNVQFSLVKHPHDLKIKFDYDKETQDKLEKRKYYLTVLVLLLFLAAQLVFLIMHAVLNVKALAYFEQTPYDIDTAAKLTILPSYLLAGLYLPLPTELATTYANDVASALSFPISSVPQLYDLLAQPPCETCTFMYPVLTTNYKSFYATFQQRVKQMKGTTLNNNTISDLFYAADYVVERVFEVLYAQDYNYLDSSLVAFAIAMFILCAAIYWGTRSISDQVQQLELFLRFFSEEMITKNKHMNRLFSNTT